MNKRMATTAVALVMVAGLAVFGLGNGVGARQDGELAADAIAGLVITEQMVDATDETVDTFGDWLVYSGSIVDEAGEEIGEEHGTCTFMDEDHGWLCEGVIVLEDGTIATSGMSVEGAAGDESLLAIVGGTGVYANAGGEISQLVGEEADTFGYVVVIDVE